MHFTNNVIIDIWCQTKNLTTVHRLLREAPDNIWASWEEIFLVLYYYYTNIQLDLSERECSTAEDIDQMEEDLLAAEESHAEEDAGLEDIALEGSRLLGMSF